jgi:hypothetical protein
LAIVIFIDHVVIVIVRITLIPDSIGINIELFRIVGIRAIIDIVKNAIIILIFRSRRATG